VKTILVVGATSAIATECARQLAGLHACNFILVGRNDELLKNSLEDLRLRGAGRVSALPIKDMTDPDSVEAVVMRAFSESHVDLAIVAQGTLPSQAEVQVNLNALRASLEINAISVALFAESIFGRLEQQRFGRLAVIGSVAGDRSRKSNYAYGAAKAFVSSYADGLRHRAGGTRVGVTTIKPGPVLTPMTQQRPQSAKSLARVDRVARVIISGLERGNDVIYAPSRWRLIMAVIRGIPKTIFDRLDF
jgi:decaprenylphospho-beta-D-erythro-pentofuranosid-2-ulose 2-reductase